MLGNICGAIALTIERVRRAITQFPINEKFTGGKILPVLLNRYGCFFSV